MFPTNDEEHIVKGLATVMGVAANGIFWMEEEWFISFSVEEMNWEG
jgi:hypothetical protein